MALDILILIILIVAGAMGFAKGIISQAGQIVAVIAGIISARLLGQTVTDFFAGDGGATAIDTVGGYGVAFLVAYGVAWLIFRMARGIFHAVHLGIIDRLAGAAFKILQWALMLSLAVNFYLLVSGDDTRLHDESKPWRGAVVKIAPVTLGYLSDLIKNHEADKVKADEVKADEK